KQSDMLALQDDISREIVEKLRYRLTGEEAKRVQKRYTGDPEAYQLYLKGRYFWNKRDQVSAKKALQYFQQAIDRDPNYALAYAGLADTYGLLSSPRENTEAESRAAARRAVELDGSLAEAH